jgi:hypothetical protein
MELVSVAARLAWSDRPSCTHPLLGHLARRVNDATSDENRPRLLHLVPALAVATTRDPRAHASIAAACTGVALARRPTLLLHALDRAAARRAEPSSRGRRPLYAHGASYRSVDLAVLAVQTLPARDADDALHAMLVAAAQAVTAGSPDDRPDDRPDDGGRTRRRLLERAPRL